MIELLDSIRYNNGKFPKRELEQIIERKEEAIPLLLQIMEEVKTDPEEFIFDAKRIDYIYVVYLLAQFRVKEFFPLFVDILSLPGDIADELFGDTTTEGVGRILASTYDGNTDLLKNIIETDEINEYVHGAALDSMVILVLHDELERDEVIKYFKELLTVKLQHAHYNIITNVVSACDSLYPEEVYPDIKRLYEQGKVDEFLIDLNYIETTLRKSKENVLNRTGQSVHFQYIRDTIEEMHWWAAFDQPESRKNNKLKSLKPSLSNTTNPAEKVEKIGRNEPCPCGSGRKYKKCCGSA